MGSDCLGFASAVVYDQSEGRMQSESETRNILVLAELEAADAVARGHDADPPGFVYSVPMPWPPSASPAD